ncbi:hypothetical protein HDU83_002998 [Entophlyctis luteolus]|nr:hypothetical protein HDU83_002998 [Entophlyctis luteolus]
MTEVQVRTFDPVLRQFVKTPIVTDTYVAISHVWGNNDVTAFLHDVSIKVASHAKAETLERLVSRSSLPCWLDLVSVNQTSWDQFSASQAPPSLVVIGTDTFVDPMFNAVSQVRGMSEIYNKSLMTFALLSETDFALLEATLKEIVYLIEHLRRIRLLNKTHEYDRYLMEKGLQNDEIEMGLIENFQRAITDWQTNSQYMGRVWTYQELTVSNDITFVSHDGSRSVSASEMILLLFQLKYDQQRNSYFNPPRVGEALHVAIVLFSRAFLPVRPGLAAIEILQNNAHNTVIEDKDNTISELLTAVKYDTLTVECTLDSYIDILLKNNGMENGWTFNSSVVPYLIEFSSNIREQFNLDNEIIDIPARNIQLWNRIHLSEVLAAMVQCQRKCYFKRDYINVLASLYAPEYITASDDDLDAKFAAFHVHLIDRGLFTLRQTENMCKFCSVTAPSWSSTLSCPKINTGHLYGDIIMRRSEHFRFLLEPPKLSLPSGVIVTLVENVDLCYGDISVALDIPNTASKFDVRRQVLLSLARMYTPNVLTRLLLNSGLIAWACQPTGLESVFEESFCAIEQCYLAHHCYVNGVKLDEVHDTSAWVKAMQGYLVLHSIDRQRTMCDLIDRWFWYMSDSFYFAGNNNGPMTVRVVKPVGSMDKDGIFVIEAHSKGKEMHQRPMRLAKWKDGSFGVIKSAENSETWNLVLNLHWSATWIITPENVLLGEDAVVI